MKLASVASRADRDYFYDTVRRELSEHGDPHVPMHKGTGCTYCQGALAALDALLAENQRLREALGFYAEKKYDGGRCAREALRSGQ